jgi:hypothetical protein
MEQTSLLQDDCMEQTALLQDDCIEQTALLHKYIITGACVTLARV